MQITTMPKGLEFKQTQYFDRDMKCEKILFLDIDGVLTNEYESRMSGSHNCINESNLNNLLYILDNVPNLKIFLSSSWRYERDLDQCNQLIKYYFGMYMLNLHGRTPVVITPKVLNSEWQIQELANNNLVCSRGYEIKYVVDALRPKQYVILDDWDNFLDEQRDFHVRTNSKTGLTFEDAEVVIHILNK